MTLIVPIPGHCLPFTFDGVFVFFFFFFILSQSEKADYSNILFYLQVSYTGHQTEGETKWKTIIPFRSRNMIQNAMLYNFQIRRFDIHGILRECLRLYHAVPSLPGMMLMTYICQCV